MKTFFQLNNFARLLAVILLTSGLCAQEGESGKQKYELLINEWLQAGPVSTPLPFAENQASKISDLLDFEPVDVATLKPSPGERLNWGGSAYAWQQKTAADSMLTLTAAEGGPLPRVIFLAAYLKAESWEKTKIEIKSHHPFALYFDGQEVAKNSKSDSADIQKVSETLKLERGQHIVVVRALRDPKVKAPWTIGGSISGTNSAGTLSIGSTKSEWMSIAHLLDAPELSSLAISPDGSIVSLSLREVNPKSGKQSAWIELRRSRDGSLMQSYRGGTALGSIVWAPDGRKFAYTDNGSDGTTLWVVDLAAGSSSALLSGIDDFAGFEWSPGGDYLIYTTSKTPDPDTRGVKLMKSPRDRWPSFRAAGDLFRVSYPHGVRQQLTAGKVTAESPAISPDGRRILFSMTTDNYAERPYTRSTISVLNLDDLTVDSLFTGMWINQMSWSPDSKQLLVNGSPSLFGPLGESVPEGVISNSYDTQAYLFDLASGTPTPISREFDPAIKSGSWSRDGKSIYFSVEDREYGSLYEYSIGKKTYQKIDLDVEVLGNFQIARNAPVMVYTGSSVTSPNRAFVYDLGKKRSRLLHDPAVAQFRDTRFGKVETWSFLNERGDEINGRVYYPPDFDSSKEYPCIVYYYGGTSVTERSFGGRYPKNLFAAQGYVVYVLNPSGAPGFGQRFSAYHVNDWGKIVSGEIISGTKQFLEAHPFVDRKRVGCIGASYGGFMTMLLHTRTDIFATGIAHAGISSIASYWGEGYWGYLYSSVAGANSFPWNRRDIYVDQSPLFNADKVTRPLLLVSGDADTNVPRGESDQFYLALKLLGKEVEYLRVADQDHHILDYKKRIIWQKSILAWFDKYLKDQPEWWEDLYPADKK